MPCRLSNTDYRIAASSQVQAIVDIILHYKWDHMSAMFSHNLYKESLIDHLHYLAKENDICLDCVQPIYTDFAQPDFLKPSKELMTSYAILPTMHTTKPSIHTLRK